MQTWTWLSTYHKYNNIIYKHTYFHQQGHHQSHDDICNCVGIQSKQFFINKHCQSLDVVLYSVVAYHCLIAQPSSLPPYSTETPWLQAQVDTYHIRTYKRLKSNAYTAVHCFFNIRVIVTYLFSARRTCFHQIFIFTIDGKFFEVSFGLKKIRFHLYS